MPQLMVRQIHDLESLLEKEQEEGRKEGRDGDGDRDWDGGVGGGRACLKVWTGACHSFIGHAYPMITLKPLS